MTPAQELRAAVKVLRCEHRFPVLPPLGSLAHPGDCSNCGVAWGHHEAVADDLKAPLAAWLENEATWAEQHAGIPNGLNALAFTRALLGGEPL